MSLRVRERADLQPPDRVRQKLLEASALVDPQHFTPEERVALLPAVFNVLCAQHIELEQIMPGALGIIGGKG